MNKGYTRMFLAGIAAACFVATGCAKPPTQEMADAKAAITAAKVAEADVYAPENYSSAEEMLARAESEVNKKEYETARDYALRSLSLAEQAKAAAQRLKEEAKNEATRVLNDLKTAMNAAEGAGGRRYKSAEMAKLSSTQADLDSAFKAERYKEVIFRGREAIAKADEIACDSRLMASEEARRKAEAEALEANRRASEEAAKRAAEEAARLKAEEEARKCAEELARKQAAKADSHKVKRGECLWVISNKESVYDNPFQWPLIYKANRSQIRDPDLIFPRQVFKIPRDFSSDEKAQAIHMAATRGPWSLYDGK